MSNQPSVSIVIPCYQAERTVSQTLEDIFHQTYDSIEIIAVNDGSTDQTASILSQYRSRIRIISQQNRGGSAARNAGFREVHGSYVLFCDADVRLQPTMVAKMVDTLARHPEAAYCYCNFKFGFHTFDLFPFDADRLRKENYISTMSLIRRERFIGFNEQLKRFQDWDLWKRMLERGSIGAWYPERLFTCPINGGISSYSIRNIAKIAWRRVTGIFR
jgi:glycosyltransferase involved in cell wall biosynthesis